MLRLLVGLIGLLALFMAARLWLDPTSTALKLGLMTQAVLGQATARADLGGFFGVVGALAVLASIRSDGSRLTVPVFLIGAALTGRVITAIVSGISPPLVPPMVVEAVILVVFVAAWRNLRTA